MTDGGGATFDAEEFRRLVYAFDYCAASKGTIAEYKQLAVAVARFVSFNADAILAAFAERDRLRRPIAPPGDHPWTRFLEARAELIREFTAEGNSIEEISDVLSADAEQCRAILIATSNAQAYADGTVKVKP